MDASLQVLVRHLEETDADHAHDGAGGFARPRPAHHHRVVLRRDQLALVDAELVREVGDALQDAQQSVAVELVEENLRRSGAEHVLGVGFGGELVLDLLDDLDGELDLTAESVHTGCVDVFLTDDIFDKVFGAFRRSYRSCSAELLDA